MSVASMPRSRMPPCKRNSARLDVLTSMLNGPKRHRDSLSPLDEVAKYELKEQSFSDGNNDLNSCREEQTKQEPHFTFQHSPPKHEVARSPTSTEACSPRSPLITRDYKPSDLKLTRTNGLTTVPIRELKRCIGDARTETGATITQIARPKTKQQYPQTPATPSPIIVMGNRPSSIAGSPAPDNASGHSVVRNPVRILRKSSTNLFKRHDSKSPLPPNYSATVIQVQQQASGSTLDGVSDDKDKDLTDPFMDSQRSSESAELVPVRSDSTKTITDENATQPLSAASTVRERRADSHSTTRANSRSPHHEEEESSESELHPDFHSIELKELQPSSAKHHSPHNRRLVLSPSIPAPSPLKEDSPHGYGLKDRTDTPDMVEPEEINVVKARRRSSGLDIFNEAKSLQSASSFLNGLSTSRRRAESNQRSTDTSAWRHTSYESRTSRPPSTPRLSSSRPSSRPNNLARGYSSDRYRDHNFKASGFAYTRPLTMAQMKCYRGHVHLLPSRNKKAPVECAVCHIDDDAEHYSCSWCALRMCRFCRKDFEERGIVALKQRIRQAEMGGQSPSSSVEDLTEGGRSMVGY